MKPGPVCKIGWIPHDHRELDGTIHVVPAFFENEQVLSVFGHQMDVLCWCGPNVMPCETTKEVLIVTHNHTNLEILP